MGKRHHKKWDKDRHEYQHQDQFADVDKKPYSEGGEHRNMNPLEETQLKDLEAQKTAGTITPEGEAVRVALLEKDEQVENKAEADKALADAIAAVTPPSVPQAVVDAQKAVDDAKVALDASQKALDDAEAALNVVIAPAV